MGRPEDVGLSTERLARLDQILTERYVDSGQLPGIITQVYRGGTLAHSAMSGLMDIERHTPMREDAIFRIYSMSKPITAVALMMLVEEGKIGLDDDVHTHIPSWTGLGVYATGIQAAVVGATSDAFVTAAPKRPMKVVDLVTHTSGLTYGFMARTSVDAAYRKRKIGDHDTDGGLDTFIEQLAELPLDFSPGDHWSYSVSIDVMGYLVQKLSGMSFGEFLRTRLFEPLQMHDTGFHCPDDKVDRFASCYQPGPNNLLLQDDARSSTYATPPALESGGGGLVSTAHDYMRFCRMMLGGGTLDGARILSPKTVAMFGLNLLPDGQLLTDMVPGVGMFSEAGYAGVGFSIGCGVTIDVAQTLVPGTPGEFFWGGAASTAFWIDPVEDLAVVFMTQVVGAEARLAIRRDLRTLVYSSLTDSYA